MNLGWDCCFSFPIDASVRRYLILCQFSIFNCLLPNIFLRRVGSTAGALCKVRWKFTASQYRLVLNAEREWKQFNSTLLILGKILYYRDYEPIIKRHMTSSSYTLHNQDSRTLDNGVKPDKRKRPTQNETLGQPPNKRQVGSSIIENPTRYSRC